MDETNGRPTVYAAEENFSAYDRACHSQVCAGCSSLCDDISVYIKAKQVVRTLNLCEIGMKRLRTLAAAERIPPLPPEALSGRVRRAAELLQAGGPPLILGADSLEAGGIRASFDLALALSGLWLPWSYQGVRDFYTHAVKYGWAMAFWDEVRDRAELVLFWRADPLDTHHRHLSRFSFYARGRYAERGHADRNLAVVASGRTVIEPLCQQYFDMPPDEDVPFIKALMNPPQASVPAHRDFPLLLNAWQRAAYIAVFVDPEKTSLEALQALFEWALSVNRAGQKRLVLLPLLTGGANSAGFTEISLELAGAPWGLPLLFGSRGMQFYSDTPEIAAQIGSVLMIESGPEGAHRRRLPETLLGKPLTVITPFKEAPRDKAEVVIPVALAGLEAAGEFYRGDGLPLMAEGLPEWPAGGYLSAEEVLRQILHEVKK